MTSPSASSAHCPRAARRASLALSLLALAAGVGCAQAEIPEVVVTRSDVAFPGMPSVAGLSAVTDEENPLSTTFDHPSDLELPSSLNPELRPLSASISGRDDMRDLSFLEGLTVTLRSRAPDAPPEHIVATYARRQSTGVGRVVELETDGDSDVLSFWDTHEAFYEIKLWGEMPEQDWAIDVTFAFEGEISM